MKNREPDNSTNIQRNRYENFIYQEIAQSNDPHETILSLGNIAYDIHRVLVNINDFLKFKQTIEDEIMQDKVYRFILNNINTRAIIEENEENKDTGFNVILVPDSSSRSMNYMFDEYDSENFSNFLESSYSDTTRLNLILLQDKSRICIEANTLRALKLTLGEKLVFRNNAMFSEGTCVCYSFTIADDNLSQIHMHHIECTSLRGRVTDVEPTSVIEYDFSDIILRHSRMDGDGDECFRGVVMGKASRDKNSGSGILNNLSDSIKLLCFGLAKTGHKDIIKKHNLGEHITNIEYSRNKLNIFNSFWDDLHNDIYDIQENTLFTVNSTDVAGYYGQVISFNEVLGRTMEAIGEHVFH